MNPNRLPFSFKLFRLAGLFAVLALLLAACQPAATPILAPTLPPAPAATSAPIATSAPQVQEPTLKVADDPKLGKILTDEKGMTLYIFTKDSADTSNCNAGCLANWPPLLTAGSPKAGDGVTAAMLGSAVLADGRKIVTYNHMPLYYWVKDTKAGDTTGQNVGKVWFVLNPSGTAVKEIPAAAVPAAAEATLKVADDPKLGKILTDDKGMTLYIYTKDSADTSNCSGGCLANWPPLLTAGSPKAGDGVTAALLGSASLSDGRKIVTYNHMPLYYWVKDTKAGDTTGQNVGKVWFVINPSGVAVKEIPAAAAPVTAKVDTGYDTAPKATSEATLNVVDDPKLGKILVDGKGMTLYLYKKDAPGKSNCSGGCLAAWPPLLTQGQPSVGPGVDSTKIGSAKLADGSLIVTYAGMPLYYYVKDAKAGDTTGQGAGSVWYVVMP